MAKDPITPIKAAQRQCPICGKPATSRHQPFCSAPCTQIDLGRWLKGSYSVPTDEPPEDTPEAGEREE
jgi:endogenous inhibitor of DNA gyrase (YacG/DUF329 family)